MGDIQMKKKVCILLSTYNGEKYLSEQLNSILSQSYENIEILVRDDGSTDNTVDILEDFKRRYSNITLFLEKNVGVRKSFYILLNYGYSRDEVEYFSFCDQDDVWLPEKIEKAVSQMEQIPNDNLLYCSTLNLVGQDLSFIKKTRILTPDKSNAMIQNIVTGCTTVINRNLAKILTNNEPCWENTEMHDSWFYLIASFLGRVIFDEESYIYYRQHSSNVVGLPSNKLEVIQNSIYGLKKESTTKIHRKQLREFYSLFYNQLIKEDKENIELFLNPNQNIFNRIKSINKVDVFKQSRIKTYIYKLMYVFKLV